MNHALLALVLLHIKKLAKIFRIMISGKFAPGVICKHMFSIVQVRKWFA